MEELAYSHREVGWRYDQVADGETSRVMKLKIGE